MIKDYRKEPMHDGNILEPYGRQVRKNLFYSSKKSHNIRYYEMTIKYNGKEYVYIEYDVFRKYD